MNANQFILVFVFVLLLATVLVSCHIAIAEDCPVATATAFLFVTSGQPSDNISAESDTVVNSNLPTDVISSLGCGSSFKGFI